MEPNNNMALSKETIDLLDAYNKAGDVGNYYTTLETHGHNYGNLASVHDKKIKSIG